jgi:hypothetical protein
MQRTFEVWNYLYIPNGQIFEYDRKQDTLENENWKFIGKSTKEVEQPKKKVKKWRWVFQQDNELKVTGSHFIDQKDFERNGFHLSLIQKIDSTEIECEE